MKNLMYIMSAAITGCDCGGAEVLRIIKFVFTLLDVVLFVVPIGLIIMISLDFAKNVMSGKEDEMKKNLNIAIKRIIFCVAMFLVPTIVQAAIDLLGNVGVSYATCISIARADDLTDYEQCGLIYDFIQEGNVEQQEGNVEQVDTDGDTITNQLTVSTLKIKNLPKMMAANEWTKDYEEQYILTAGNEWYALKTTDNEDGEYVKVTTYVNALFQEHKEKFNNEKSTVLKSDYFFSNSYQPRYINNTKLQKQKTLKEIKANNEDYYNNIIAWLKNCLGSNYHSYIHDIDDQYVWYSTFDHDGDNEGTYLVWIGNGYKTGEYFGVKWTEPPKGSCQSVI